MKFAVLALPVAALLAATPAAAQSWGEPQAETRGPWDQYQGRMTLYPQPGYRGAPYVISQDLSNLPREYNDGAMSLRLEGRGAWEICADSGYRRCQRVTDDVRDLRALGLGQSISSVRRVDTQAGGWGGQQGWNGQQGAGSLTLYAAPNFLGRGFSTNRPYSNLPFGQNDAAMSLRVEGGAWEVCVDSDFRGRCEVVTRDVRDLRSLGLSGVISSVRPAGGANWGGGWGGSGGGGGPSPNYGPPATLFSGPDYTGPSFSTTQAYTNLPRQHNDQALSLRIEGRGAWEVCADADFRGRCQVFTTSVPDLRAYGMGQAISSLRPVR